jgi:hypothetical protein
MVTANGIGEFTHSTIAKSTAKMSNDATNGCGFELLVVPHVMEEIQVRDVLVRAARDPIKDPKSASVPEMKRLSAPRDRER